MGEKTCARLLRLLVRAGGRCRREGREVGALDQGMRSEAAPQQRGEYIRFRGWEIEAEKATRCG